MTKIPKARVLTETLSVRLPLEEFRALCECARAESRTVSNLVRVLLRQRRIERDS
jgi:hypothetical protein